ncbi:Histone deacetylase HDT1 [Glycine soja]|nr:Histone deacetylase HDT1 [Glycine soja]
MEFWGVEVKSGESLKVDPGDDKIIHLSNACLGDVTKDKEGLPVALYVKFGNQKLVLGTLSSEAFPQISYDLVFEKEFELSHNWKHGSVFFTGFKAQSQSDTDNDEDSDDFDEDIPVSAANGKPEIEVKNGIKPDANEAKQKKIANGEDEDSSESESDDDSSEDQLTANGDIESSEGDDDSDDEEEGDDESDEETPKKIEASNKRGIDSSKKTPVPVKKTKFVTPQKTDSKNVVHVATPHPSKQTGKATANNKQQTPKSGGDYSCKPCSRSFKTEDALSSHNKAKHSTK